MAIRPEELQKLSTYQDRNSVLPPTIASAAVIAPTQFLSKVSGTIPISTITPVTDGAHLICLIFTDSAPAAFLTTGNIQTSVQPVQNTALFLMFDPVLGKYCPATVPAASGGTSGTFQNSFLVSGGQIVWVSNYNFTVTAAQYYILGQLYNSPQTDVTLDTAHATLDRIDIVAVNELSQVVKITGTPAAQPSIPAYDPGTQLPLGFIFVKANTTQPSGVVSTLLYAENAGGPAEWNWATSGAGFNVNSSGDPQPPSTKCIEATAVLSPAYAEGTIPSSTLSLATGGQLIINIKSKAAWPQKGGLILSFRDAAGAVVGTQLGFSRNSFGFDSSQVASYQLISIPVSNFAVGATPVSKFRIASSSPTQSLGAFFDNISIQTGAVEQPPAGLTVEQADARYLMLSTSDDIGITVDGGGSVPATGQKGYKFIPYGFNVVGWALIADQSGSCVFDIWVDTYPNVPAVADSITAAAKPTLSAAQINFSTAVGTWNTGPFLPSATGQPRVVGYNLDSISTITRVHLALFIKKINT